MAIVNSLGKLKKHDTEKIILLCQGNHLNMMLKALNMPGNTVKLYETKKEREIQHLFPTPANKEKLQPNLQN